MMNYKVLTISFLIAMIASACGNHYFHMQTDDFHIYSTETSPNTTRLKKYNEGIYMFLLAEEKIIIDGFEFDWYRETTLQERDATLQDSTGRYAFIAFLDEHRVYYYSSNRELLEKGWKNDKHDIILNERKNDKDDVFQMRGYYSIEQKDAIWQVHLDLERPRRGKKRRYTSGDEPKIKAERVQLEFELDADDNLVMRQFAKRGFNEIRTPNRQRYIYPDSTLAIVPHYVFQKKNIDLYLNEKDDGSGKPKQYQVENIERKNGIIVYHIKNSRTRIEDLKSVFSW